MPADVTVIVPAYNAAQTITRALASVARQTVLPREVIVVDDGSDDDGTYAAAQAMASALGSIALCVLRQPNLGAGAARNRALTEARGKLVAFLDADDEWLPEKLERSLARLNRPSLCLVAHNSWRIEGHAQSLLDTAARFRASTGDLTHGLYRRGFIATSSVVARRVAIMAAGGFDETLRAGQDFDLWLKMLLQPGAEFDVFEDALARHYVSASGITANAERRLECTLKIARQHAPRLKALTGRCFASLWFRVAAVHAEALVSHSSRRCYGAALTSVLRLPFELVRLSIAVLGTDVARYAPLGRWSTTSAVLWIAGGMGVYLFQFRAIAGYVLAAFGLGG